MFPLGFCSKFFELKRSFWTSLYSFWEELDTNTAIVMSELLVLFLLCLIPSSLQLSLLEKRARKHKKICGTISAPLKQGLSFHDMHCSICVVSRESKRSTLAWLNLLEISLDILGFSFYSIDSWSCRDSHSGWIFFKVWR